MEKSFQVSDGFLHRTIADVDVLISIGDRIADFNGYVTLNETCAFLWDHLQTPQTAAALADRLCGEYEVTYEQALQDVQEFLQSLLDQGMLREVVQ